MQLKAREIAIFLQVLILFLSVGGSTQAQVLPYGSVACTKVVSIVACQSSNFLLLNLQSKQVPEAPHIQFFPGMDGTTIMVADFPGLRWTSESRIIHPRSRHIQSVRLGQFQESPPVFRISVTADNQRSLKSLEFTTQDNRLLIKLPEDLESRAELAAIAPNSGGLKTAAKASNNPRAAIYEKAKSVLKNSGSNTFSTDSKHSMSSKYPALKQANSSSSRSSVNETKPPFKTGGLYLSLSAQEDQIDLDKQKSKEIESKAKAAPGLKLLPPLADTSRRIVELENFPPLAPDFRAGKVGVENSSVDKGPKFLREAIAGAESGQGSKSETALAKLETRFSGSNPFQVDLMLKTKQNYKAFRLDDPARFVIDFEDMPFELDALVETPPNPYLKSLRFGKPEERISRLVLDLNSENVSVKQRYDEQNNVLSLVLEGGSIFAPAHRKPLVVLDAGHGGSDPGAQRGDIQEKDLTLQVCKKLKAYLEERGLQVVMTREDDSTVSLEERVKIANQVGPDCFLSVHINSLETDRDIKGIETYYQTEQSRAFAGHIHQQLLEKLNVPDRSVRKARFYVVNHTLKPAVLAEIGFISNKEERDKLISSEYQVKVAESLAQGVILFLQSAGSVNKFEIGAGQKESATKAAQVSGSGLSLAKAGLNAVKQ